MSNEATFTRILRLLGAAIITFALAVQAWADLTYGTFTWGQLPGYFTPLANLAGIVALVAAAVVGGREPRWVALLRVNAATYLVIVGAVYWAMLASYAQPLFPWANAILHGGAGVMLAADWLLVRPRVRLPLSSLWSVLSLPAVWVSYLMVRAFLDGWVPYPFLDPARGVLAITATLAAISAAGLAVAAVLHGTARMRPFPAPLRAVRAATPASSPRGGATPVAAVTAQTATGSSRGR
ncbi:Pr6Pr family membrane protein [Demequina pelophila]|uniref:Pr6Pr family membrane protein n=1 Tax=Demequina pelophila TaxID=1638984 RepID=UPI000782D632|nr:Pr6Pr family membrane protein [Demequina pelophila]